MDKYIAEKLRLSLMRLTTLGIREAALLSASKAQGYPGEALDQRQFLHLYGMPCYSMRVVMEVAEAKGDEHVPHIYVSCLDKIFDTIEALLCCLVRIDRPIVDSEGAEGSIHTKSMSNVGRFQVVQGRFIDLAPETFTKLREALQISTPEYVA